MPRIDFKPWRSVLIYIARYIEEARLDIIIKINLAGDELLRNVVSRGQSRALAVEPAFINSCEPADHLIRECFGARTGQNSELRGIGVAHAEYLQSTGLESRLLFRSSDVNARHPPRFTIDNSRGIVIPSADLPPATG
jgi:hypothetical protein